MDLAVRNYGKSHFPLEGFILNGAQKLCIHVRTPQDMGLDMQMFRPADQERHDVFFRDPLDGWGLYQTCRLRLRFLAVVPPTLRSQPQA